MVQGGNVMVHMSPQVAGSVGKGLARLGQTLAGVGVEAAGVLAKTAQADEQGRINDWMRAREKELNEYQATLPQYDNEPMRAMEGFDKLNQQSLHSIDNLEFSREGKRRLIEEYKRVSHRYEMNFSSWVHGKTIANTRKFGMERYNGMKASRNWEEAKAMLVKLHGEHTISDADYEKAYRDLKKEEKEDTLRTQIQSDPLGQLEDIEAGNGEWGKMSSEERDKYGNIARRKVALAESSELDELGAELNDPEFDLDTFLENKENGKYDHIGKKALAHTESALRSNVPPTDDEVWAASQAIEALSEKRKKLSPQEYQREFNNVTGIVLPLVRGKRNGWLSDMLYRHNPGISGDGGRQGRIKTAKAYEIATADMVLEAMHKTNSLEGFGDPEEPNEKDIRAMRGYKKEFRDWIENYKGDVDSPQFEKDAKAALEGIITKKGMNDANQIMDRNVGTGETDNFSRLYDAHSDAVDKIQAAEQGGISFPGNFPMVQNEDGSKSNVKLSTVIHKGRHYVVPTMMDGKSMDDDSFRSYFENNFRDLPNFKTEDEANKWIQENHGNIDESGNVGYSTTPVKGKHGDYQVIAATRDQLKGVKSRPGQRIISTDFNDAENKSAKGIEVKVPSDATPEEIAHAKQWAQEVHAFFARHGHDVPIRQQGTGIKKGGRGISGYFHTEPFFIHDEKARQIMEEHYEEYAQITGQTLGQIAGATFILPHLSGDAGAEGFGMTERNFAKTKIIPNL